SAAANCTRQAIHDADLTGDGDASAMTPSAQVPFSSRRRWSALELGSDRLVLGAPQTRLETGGNPRPRGTSEAASGRRVLALASATGPLPPPAPDASLPDG